MEGASVVPQAPDAPHTGDSETKKDLAAQPEAHDLRIHEVLLILVVSALPSVLVIMLLSDVGFGIKFYSALAPPIMNLAGNGIIAVGSLIAAIFAILDWIRWSRAAQAASSLLVVYIIVAGAILKSRWYPQAPIVIILFHIPASLGVLRMLILRKVRRSSFYHATTACCLIVGFACLAVWLLWQFVESFDGSNKWGDATKARLVEDSADIYKEFKYAPNGNERAIDYRWDCYKYSRVSYDYTTIGPGNYTLSSQDKADRGDACARVKTIWFLSWMAPFISFSINLVIAIFCVINGAYLDPDTGKLEKVLKRFVIMIAVLVICMWCSASVGAASMRLSGVLMAFCGAGLLALIAWVFLRLGLREIASKTKTSQGLKTFMDMAQNDWSRACVVIGMNVMMPIILLINILNQTFRRAAKGDDHPGKFTKEVEPIIKDVLNWSWGSILVKANRLVQAYFVLSIGVAKITYVFLSWLNETLLEWTMPAVLGTFFMIGLTMFMLPPVPGIPVYICSGIVIAARARTTSVGYGGGIAIAIFLSFILKLVAVAGQYMIGKMAGQSVSVQKFVGVDKVVIRAIESVLRTTGINKQKVAVLVGGPDWPTSVLCGILNLNLFQCILGTCPVILVSSPCVLAGAFMSGPNEPNPETAGEKGIWDTLASTMLGASAMCQLASGVLAIYFTQEVIFAKGESLAEPRPEHAAVLELTKKEAAMVECYNKVIAWTNIPLLPKIALIASNVIMLMSFFLFMMNDESCFRPFQVSNRIGDDYDDYGLDGKPLSIVLKPGWAALALFGSGCLLDFIFCKWASITAKNRMKSGTTDPEPGDPPKNAW